MLDEPVYLYVKTHDVTGLKYFGRTTEDPYRYSGSGAYWTRHLEEYGNRVTTTVLGYYIDEDELRSAALEFSAKNRIATSTDWANLLPEDGGQAGAGWSSDRSFGDKIAALDISVQSRMNTQGISTSKNGYLTAEQTDQEDKRFYWCLGITAVIFGLYLQSGSQPGDGYADDAEWMQFVLGAGVAILTPIGWIPAAIAHWIIDKLF